MFQFELLFLSSTLIFASVHADSCRFQGTKGVIDLTSLGRTDGVAAFSDLSPGVASNYKYSYNPCKPFTEGSECFNVAACQVSNDLKYRFAIGSQDSAQWNEGAGLGSSPSVTYTAGEKTTIVTLACGGDTVQLEALGENPTNTYKLRLTHKCACWDGCGGSPGTSSVRPGPPSGGGSGKTSGGLIFVIIIIVVVVLYVVGFSTLNYFQHQRRGVEVLPHRLFWIALVGYARDGTVFIYRRVTGKGDTNYSSV